MSSTFTFTMASVGFGTAFRGFATTVALGFALLTTPISAKVDRRCGEPFASDHISAFGSTACRLAQSEPDMTRGSFLASRGLVERADLPYILIGVGAQKCGTTFLWKVLRQHPDVISGEKETRWFTKPSQSLCKFHPKVLGDSELDDDWLGHHKQCTSVVPEGAEPSMLQRYIDKCFCGMLPQGNQTILDMSPGYSRRGHEMAIHNMKMLQADAVLRFVMVLRDPVDRILSEFNMKRKNGITSSGDDELLRSLERNVDRGGNSTVKGQYHEAIKRWFFNFGNSSLLVINSAELDNLETWRRIFKHAGLRPLPKANITEMLAVAHREYEAKQRQKKKRSSFRQLKLPDRMMHKLAAHYKPFNELLWETLGTRWW